MACNTCHCTKKSLVCTKVACIDWKPSKLKHTNSTVKTTLRSKLKSPDYPDLPEGPCEPGKLYKDGCSICFCEKNKKATCSKNDVCRMKKANLYTTLEAIHPLFQSTPEQNISSLPTQASKCEPGEPYRVDCNSCLCLHNNNLVCTKMLCLSYNDMQRVEAKKYTGLPCTDLDKVKDECIKCRCVKNKLDCEPIYGCVKNKLKQKLLHGVKLPRMTLNLKKHKCTELSIYRDDCNLCFCRGGALRCTQKTCLKYRQVVQFQKQRLYLEQHGL